MNNNIYCSNCAVRPKEVKCDGCNDRFCRGCHEEHKCSDLIDQAAQIPELIYSTREDNIGAVEQISRYFTEETKIIDNYHQQRVKQLEAANAELERKQFDLNDQLQRLEIQYKEELKSISDVNLNDKLAAIAADIEGKYQQRIVELEAKNAQLISNIEKKVQSPVNTPRPSSPVSPLAITVSQAPTPPVQQQPKLPRVASISKKQNQKV